MNIEQYFKDKKGITIDDAFRSGMRYTSIDLCKFAKKFSEQNDKKYNEMYEVLKEVDRLLEDYFNKTGHNDRENAIAGKVNALINEIES